MHLKNVLLCFSIIGFNGVHCYGMGTIRPFKRPTTTIALEHKRPKTAAEKKLEQAEAYLDAASTGQISLLKKYLEQDKEAVLTATRHYDPNFPNRWDDGNTVLHEACRLGFSIRNYVGEPSFYYAPWVKPENYPPTVMILLWAGANPHTTNKKGQTPKDILQSVKEIALPIKETINNSYETYRKLLGEGERLTLSQKELDEIKDFHTQQIQEQLSDIDTSLAAIKEIEKLFEFYSTSPQYRGYCERYS